MDSDQLDPVKQLLQDRQKLQEKKWKIQRKLDNVGWQIWWLNWQIKFKNIKTQLRLYPAYYTKRAVGVCVIIAIAAVVYRIYHTVDEADDGEQPGDTKDVV